MIENYQEEQQLQQTEPSEATFATVAGVYSDGVSLIFDGESAGDSSKHYKCNRSCIFNTGDRVRISKDSGSYVVEYPVGTPTFESYAASAGTSDLAMTVDNYAPGIANLRFYSDTQGTLWVQSVMDAVNKWTKLTGTVGKPPKL